MKWTDAYEPSRDEPGDAWLLWIVVAAMGAALAIGAAVRRLRCPWGMAAFALIVGLVAAFARGGR
jgi:asparagine N-glycosylation enzyme membrane subunit Stt3